MSNTDQPDLLLASMQLVTAYLSNPHTQVAASDLPSLLSSVHEAAKRMAGGQAVDAPAAVEDANRMPPEVHATLEGSEVALDEMPSRGAALDHGVWHDVPEETRAKFRKLIERFNIPVGLDGYPIPRAKPDSLISPDGSHVTDPIDGKQYVMLRRHIRLDYDLSHDELLKMYGLTKQQLPKAGPTYSRAKADQARRGGLGKSRKEDQAAA